MSFILIYLIHFSYLGEHKRAFYKIISGQSVDTEDDSNCIGLHLNVEHGLSKKEDFNINVLVCILENTSPKLKLSYFFDILINFGVMITKCFN